MTEHEDLINKSGDACASNRIEICGSPESGRPDKFLSIHTIDREPLPNPDKPKDYLFIRSGGNVEVVKGAMSLKEAITEIEHNDLLKKALTAFDDNDINEIIELAKKFSYTIYDIEQVYIVERKIYDQYSVQCVQISDGRY